MYFTIPKKYHNNNKTYYSESFVFGISNSLYLCICVSIIDHDHDHDIQEMSLYGTKNTHSRAKNETNL